jgi:hypothetical protein
VTNENHVTHNVFDQDDEHTRDPSYPDLANVISFEGFDYDAGTYQEQERELLQPQLEALGYTEIVWFPGEVDSFGPLTRLVMCINPDGNVVTFIYG